MRCINKIISYVLVVSMCVSMLPNFWVGYATKVENDTGLTSTYKDLGIEAEQEIGSVQTIKLNEQQEAGTQQSLGTLQRSLGGAQLFAAEGGEVSAPRELQFTGKLSDSSLAHDIEHTLALGLNIYDASGNLIYNDEKEKYFGAEEWIQNPDNPDDPDDQILDVPVDYTLDETFNLWRFSFEFTGDASNIQYEIYIRHTDDCTSGMTPINRVLITHTGVTGDDSRTINLSLDSDAPDVGITTPYYLQLENMPTEVESSELGEVQLVLGDAILATDFTEDDFLANGWEQFTSSLPNDAWTLDWELQGTGSLDVTQSTTDDGKPAFDITGLESDTTVTIKAKATHIMADGTKITLENSVDCLLKSGYQPKGVAEITKAEYVIHEKDDGTYEEYIDIIVKSNRNKEADVFVDGVKHHIEFEKKWFGGYKDYNLQVPCSDVKEPNPPKNVSITRATDGTQKLVIAWEDGDDSANRKEVYAESEKGVSAKVYANLKSDTSYVINVINPSGTNSTVSLDASTPDDNKAGTGECVRHNEQINFLSFEWGSTITLQVTDMMKNKSSEVVIAVPNSVIYTTKTVDDSLEVSEASTGALNVKANDIHDPWFAIPDLDNIVNLGESGKASLVDASQLTDLPEGSTGMMVSYSSQDGVYDDVELEYTYQQVRSDIPPAVGKVKVHVKMRNQEPHIADDPQSVTKDIVAESGIQFRIHKLVLLENDSDRETDWKDLIITDVRNCSAGTVRVIGDYVVVDPSPGVYGILTFEYRISDGEIKSNSWGKVQVLVTKPNDPPNAHDGEYWMQLSDTTLAITPHVTTPSNGWSFVGQPQLYDDKGNRISTLKAELQIQMREDSQLSFKVPYLMLKVHDDTYFKDGDNLKIPYSVTNIYGTTSAEITIHMTTSDDPRDMEGYLYVHRRPLAMFGFQVYWKDDDKETQTMRKVEVPAGTEISYDLDHQLSHDRSNTSVDKIPDYSDKGLRTWEWAVKYLDGEWTMKQFDADDYDGQATKARTAGIAWINNEIKKLVDANGQKALIISLRVRDIDGPDLIGAWSEEHRELVTATPMPPVAMFTLDKSTYEVSKSEEFVIDVTDMSYDSNGDDIKKWTWTLTAPDGSYLLKEQDYDYFDKPEFSKVISDLIKNYVTNPNRPYNPEKPKFKLSLIVTEDTPEELKSDMYSVTFDVYLRNEPPQITDKPGADTATIESSTLYEIDDGLDGTIGDDWGTLGNTVHKGTINFPGLFTITDDQPVSELRVSYMFEGERVTKRSQFNDNSLTTYCNKSYLNLTYEPFESPFTNTVTDQGFKPGAYKLSVSVRDNPTGNGYASNSAQTSYWQTFATRSPFHFYVVPKLDLFMHNRVGEWIDQSIRESDNMTYDEVGLEFEDILPTIGDTIELFGTTNQFVVNLWGYIDTNGNNQYDEDEEEKFVYQRISTSLDGERYWESEYTIDDIGEEDAGSDFATLPIRIVGETTWGSEDDEVTRTKQIEMDLKVIPVKLYDFRVTSVTDPDISDEFDTYVGTLSGLRLSSGSVMDGVPVGHLAIDKNTTSSLMRKGYSFYYKVCSKGLKKDDDEVRIFPRFYAIEKDEAGNITAIGSELFGYVPDRKGVYQIYTSSASDEINEMYELFYEGTRDHSLHTHEEVRIPISLRTEAGNEQTWSGRYGIPADAKFFPSGSTISQVNEYKGDILVTFDIKAYKKGKPRFDYVERSQWLKERNAVPNGLKEIYAQQEEQWKANNEFLGSVITYNGRDSIRDNYISRPVWQE